MSLSSHDEDPPKTAPTTSSMVSLDAVKDPDSLGPIFSTSMRFSERRPGSRRPQRTASGDFSDSAQNVMQMSVATLNDQFNGSSYGDSIVNMSDSQAEMSFSNVFEDTDQEIFVNQIRWSSRPNVRCWGLLRVSKPRKNAVFWRFEPNSCATHYILQQNAVVFTKEATVYVCTRELVCVCE